MFCLFFDDSLNSGVAARWCSFSFVFFPLSLSLYAGDAGGVDSYRGLAILVSQYGAGATPLRSPVVLVRPRGRMVVEGEVVHNNKEKKR